MSRKLRPGFKDAKGIIETGFDYNGLIAEGTTVPTAGTTGYSPGGLFFKRSSTAGGQLYINEGTASSCAFNPLNYSAITPAGMVVPVTSSSLTITAASHHGKIMVLDLAAGIAITLPAASAGLWFRFVIKTTFTGASSIKSVTGADIMIGHATMGNDSTNSTVDFQATAANTYDTIDMLGTGNSTGGIEGQYIEIIGLATNLWFVQIQGDAAGTEATPFADTVT
jgi:hypothetical protein